MSLADKLISLHNSDEYPLHMPGHKRMDMEELSEAYHMDITEIEGYDNLYDAQGILREAMDYAADMYHCSNTYYLVNGSTTGILTAISAVADRGEYLIVADNCHRSVYAAARLNRLKVAAVNTEKNEKYHISEVIKAEIIEDIITQLADAGKNIAAVVITSPTYEGVISDIASIAEVVHNKKIPLIVDEAHGAHLGLDSRLPESALKGGADIVIHSTHKTLAAMTQTALLHAQGALVDITKIEGFWSTFQTSSPSYVLMASIDAALRQISEDGERLWNAFFDNRSVFDRKCENLRHLEIIKLKNVYQDPCKIVVSTHGCPVNGVWLQRRLLDTYHIQIEMANDDNVIAIVTYADTLEGFVRFADALLEIDEEIGNMTSDADALSAVTQAAGAADSKKYLYAPCVPGAD